MLAQACHLGETPQALDEHQTQHQREHPQFSDGQRTPILIGIEKAEDSVCRQPMAAAIDQFSREMINA